MSCCSSPFNSEHSWLWVPVRAEPVIGPAEGRTRWLGRDDGMVLTRRRAGLRPRHCLANLESLELRVVEIERLVVAGLLMRRAERI
ncbi:hypothetical protein SAMN05444169_3741 [Bradyrhizobium erythrophlei]|uniref:Uncharacterized protein n=1 Tax=Bradyrhizobium erythrophlei TaxID=1437360 RepID=A0A1M5LZ19_9BRAD|nr:hypothetical protein SAMN05444169_3741 [Bradyrhizobium erythrophlei]